MFTALDALSHRWGEGLTVLQVAAKSGGNVEPLICWLTATAENWSS
jgi:hypothetical protein